MINKLQSKITKRYVTASGIAAASIATFNGFFSPYFTKKANGNPYMETKLGYQPEDLFELAENYGEEGRKLYTKSAFTIDFLTPLLSCNFLVSLGLYLSGKFEGGEKFRLPIFLLGLAGCISDWTENVLMVSILQTYPKKHKALAVAARIATSVKYILTLAAVILLIVEGVFCKKKDKEAAV